MPEYNPCPIALLETPRLLLRPLAASDAGRIQLLFNNFNLLRYMSDVIPWPYPDNGAHEFIERQLLKMESHEVYCWAIIEKANTRQGAIGQISLTPNNDEDNRGFWLGEPYWGQGYMTEACLSVTDFAFGPLDMKELLLNNAEPNKASHRLKEKSGAEIIEIEELNYIGGRFPGVKWKLTAEQWTANRHRFLDE